MSGPLTGYEAESVAEVEAVLDDSPASADEVYQRTISHSERAIAAVAAKRAGGGGSMPGGVALRAPILLTKDDAAAGFDAPNGFFAIPLPDAVAEGETILGYTHRVTEVWDTSGMGLMLGPPGMTYDTEGDGVGDQFVVLVTASETDFSIPSNADLPLNLLVSVATTALGYTWDVKAGAVLYVTGNNSAADPSGPPYVAPATGASVLRLLVASAP